jgi:hypothetical protein
MFDIIDLLRQEHKEIAKILANVRALGVETPEGRKKIQEVEPFFLNHLQNEEVNIHKVLIHAGQHDQEIKVYIDRIQSELSVLSVEMVQFFLDLEQGKAGLADNFTRLGELLDLRMYQEEEILFHAYERIIKNNRGTTDMGRD